MFMFGARRVRETLAVALPAWWPLRLAALLAAAGTLSVLAPGVATADLVGEVNVFAGTAAGAPNFGTGGGAGNMNPDATLPFGMVQWGPDTIPSTVNFAGGYTYGDSHLRGLSLTHVSGTGCTFYEDFPFLPTTVPLSGSPVKPASSDLQPQYIPTFSHRFEQAAPGYYSVTLNPQTANSIGVQLAATTRTGVGRFVFPRTGNASIMVNAGGSGMADSQASIQVDPASATISGSAASGRMCYQENAYKIYFFAQFSRPFRTYGTWQRQLLLPGSTSSSDTAPLNLNYMPIPGGPDSLPGDPSGTAQSGAYVSFDTRQAPIVEVRVGVSYVSVANARANLESEDHGLTIQAARRDARKTWNRVLGSIRVSGGSGHDKNMLYTALYHALVAPNTFSDDNGQYTGMDGAVHTARGYTQYANYSANWDIYRSQVPLLAMLYPRRTSDIVSSLIADAQQSGWLPKASWANGQTDTMVGDSADPVIAGAYAFGARAFDARAALAAMVRGASQTGISSNGGYVERPALGDYLRYGYIPHEENGDAVRATLEPAIPWGTAATTLEYETDDFAIAALAADLCDTPTRGQFLARSANWRKLLDPATGYLEPRYSTGAFPSGYSLTGGDGFVEGDASQYTWMVPFDLAGLTAAIGGDRQAARRLDGFFTQLNAGPNSTYAFLGNEPTLETPWEYDWLGRPYETQAVVRRALETLYAPAPGGWPGNDDMGEMSSWWVLGALGLYPEIPGEPVLALASPLFGRTTVKLGAGTLRIDAAGANDRRPYVQSLKLDGRAYRRPWLSFAQIAHGAKLRYGLGGRPRPGWGSSAAAAPPSFGPASAPSCGV